MRSSLHRLASRESFAIVGETCPHVDSALANAADLIKQQTNALRNALTEALERAMEAEEKVSDLEREVEELRRELENALAYES